MAKTKEILTQKIGIIDMSTSFNREVNPATHDNEETRQVPEVISDSEVQTALKLLLSDNQSIDLDALATQLHEELEPSEQARLESLIEYVQNLISSKRESLANVLNRKLVKSTISTLTRNPSARRFLRRAAILGLTASATLPGLAQGATETPTRTSNNQTVASVATFEGVRVNGVNYGTPTETSTKEGIQTGWLATPPGTPVPRSTETRTLTPSATPEASSTPTPTATETATGTQEARTPEARIVLANSDVEVFNSKGERIGYLDVAAAVVPTQTPALIQGEPAVMIRYKTQDDETGNPITLNDALVRQHEVTTAKLETVSSDRDPISQSGIDSTLVAFAPGKPTETATATSFELNPEVLPEDREDMLRLIEAVQAEGKEVEWDDGLKAYKIKGSDNILALNMGILPDDPKAVQKEYTQDDISMGELTVTEAGLQRANTNRGVTLMGVTDKHPLFNEAVFFALEDPTQRDAYLTHFREYLSTNPDLDVPATADVKIYITGQNYNGFTGYRSSFNNTQSSGMRVTRDADGKVIAVEYWTTTANPAEFKSEEIMHMNMGWVVFQDFFEKLAKSQASAKNKKNPKASEVANHFYATLPQEFRTSYEAENRNLAEDPNTPITVSPVLLH